MPHRLLREMLRPLRSVQAALILGLEFRALPVSSKDNYSLTGATVRAALEEDAAKGLVPCMMSKLRVERRSRV